MPILTAAHEKASATAVASSAAGGEEVEDYAPLIYQDSQRTGEGRRPQQQLLQPSRRIRTLLLLHVELLLEQTSLPQLLLVMLHLSTLKVTAKRKRLFSAVEDGPPKKAPQKRRRKICSTDGCTNKVI